MITTTPAWSLDAVFVTDAEFHRCCSCCAGYCPRLEGDIQPTPKFGPGFVKIGDYISDHYIAIREDLISLPFDFQLIDGPGKFPAAMSIPDVKPEQETSALLTPYLAGPLLDCGIEIRQGDDKPQHLYYQDEHIGWIMCATEGYTVDKIRAMQKLLRSSAWVHDIVALVNDEPRMHVLSRLVEHSDRLTDAASLIAEVAK